MNLCYCFVIEFFFALQKLPPTIGSLSNLKVLDVEENKLEYLPVEIGVWVDEEEEEEKEEKEEEEEEEEEEKEEEEKEMDEEVGVKDEIR